jgi:hypothetical protein
VEKGASLYQLRCEGCNGVNLRNTSGGWSFDLRKLKPDEHERFVDSVTSGKDNMPSDLVLYSRHVGQGQHAVVVRHPQGRRDRGDLVLYSRHGRQVKSAGAHKTLEVSTWTGQDSARWQASAPSAF